MHYATPVEAFVSHLISIWRYRQWLSQDTDVLEECHLQHRMSPMPHKDKKNTKKNKAVDNPHSRPCVYMEAAGQEFPSWVSAAAQQGDPALPQRWGAHPAPWHCSPESSNEELKTAASAVLLWLWRSALSSSTSSQDRNSHKKLERGFTPIHEPHTMSKFPFVHPYTGVLRLPLAWP